MRYYKICVDNTKGLYTYADVDDKYDIGERVLVLFRNKKRTGLIIARDSDEEKDFKVLPIEKRVENSLKLSKEYIKLLIWIKRYYMCSYDQVVNAAIPSGLSIKYESYYTLVSFDELKNDSEVSKDIIDFFESKLKVTKATLNKNFGKDLVNEMLEKELFIKDGNNLYIDYKKEFEGRYKRILAYFKERVKIRDNTFESKFDEESIRYVVKKGYVNFGKEYLKQEKIEIDESDEEIRERNTVLNDEQEKAKNDILNGKDPYYLIRGVTGSGKTEVYISIIKEGFKEGKGSIFLVPEISLTPQMIERFKGEFKENIAILHSKLTNKERAEEWYRIYTGDKKIVLGVRSAIFAPVSLKSIPYYDKE